MEYHNGRCPNCSAALAARQLDEIQFLHCLTCGYIELDRSDHLFSGYVDEAHMRRIKTILSREEQAALAGDLPR